jgi:hypothetical protein
MISAGLAKEYNLFAPAYAYIKDTFKSNRVVLVILSAIGGILPIEGRVTVSAGLLDTVAPKCGHGREKMGIIDYLSTHHYYMWSPLEKTVVLPIAAFGLSYLAWLSLIAPLLIVTLIFISWYIWTHVKEEDVVIAPANFKLSAVTRGILPMFIAIGSYMAGYSHIVVFGLLTLYYAYTTQQWSLKKLLSYVNWNVIFVVAIAIIAGNFFKSYSNEFTDFIKGSLIDPSTFIGMLTISIIGFISSFLMGSSGKFVAIAVLMAQAFGPQYFLWFFAVDYSAYLLSPTHKCVMVGNTYFGTPLKTYYTALSSWSALMLISAAAYTFI